ncbi:Amidase enhancer precursor [Caloramator mitchellensis]|uniref:Amidase enhancer n=1 Tax=Caloramator mitchellensis TaxID=908809 RepID=A0A0R3JT95_CALMK|nr:SpoIID/LytB domain-containing protein [Caloramator mitchellensis]KRQ86743.1 Amidase enhancer precursor [Caloramator mitchellensis]
MRRRRGKNKTPAVYKYIFLAAILLSIVSYFMFLIPSKIDCGIVIEKKQYKNYTRIKVLYDSKTRWVTISKKFNIDGVALDIDLKGIRVVKVTPLKSEKGRVYEKDTKSININDKYFDFADKVSYFLKESGEYKEVKSNIVIVGHSNYTFLLNADNKIKAVISEGFPEINNIRVGISNSEFTSLEHKSIILTSKKPLNIVSEDFNISTKKKETVTITLSGGKMKLIIESPKDAYQPRKDTLITNKRVFITASESPMKLTSLQRNNGYIPEYYGTLEIFIKDNKFRMINELSIEDYLKYVVPSEMPGFGGLEGYKVQTVAARTYAFSEILGGRFSKYGFNIDDTTNSQVYNERPTNELCIQAIQETKGKVLAYGNKIIDAKYYSTSCGLGAPYNEIYPEGQSSNPKPYLEFVDFTKKNINGIQSTEDAARFFKDWTINAYDSNSPYFRWKLTLTYNELISAINKNIYQRYTKNPDAFKEKWIFNFYRKAKISEEGISKIKDIYISKRGKSGVIQELIIETEDKTLKIIGSSNIKSLFIPKDDFIVETITGLKLKNISSLPSPFFTLDKLSTERGIKSLTIYGGGYGHGVGMSQYGAMNLANQGKKYTEILNIFYKDTEIKDYNDVITNSF